MGPFAADAQLPGGEDPNEGLRCARARPRASSIWRWARTLAPLRGRACSSSAAVRALHNMRVEIRAGPPALRGTLVPGWSNGRGIAPASESGASVLVRKAPGARFCTPARGAPAPLDGNAGAAGTDPGRVVRRRRHGAQSGPLWVKRDRGRGRRRRAGRHPVLGLPEEHGQRADLFPLADQAHVAQPSGGAHTHGKLSPCGFHRSPSPPVHAGDRVLLRRKRLEEGPTEGIEPRWCTRMSTYFRVSKPGDLGGAPHGLPSPNADPASSGLRRPTGVPGAGPLLGQGDPGLIIILSRHPAVALSAPGRLRRAGGEEGLFGGG